MSHICPSHGCGYVYFLFNEAMHGLLKIGFTTSALDTRLSKLHTTGVPKPFFLGAAFHVANPAQCEAELHRLLADRRETDEREFFRVTLAEALTICSGSIEHYMVQVGPVGNTEPSRKPLDVDQDDNYFMQFIMHDGIDTEKGLSAKELAEHHTKYHPLELERKLLRLSDLGLIKRVGRGGQVESRWWMTSEGIKCMFDGGHTLQDIFEDYRNHPAPGPHRR